MTGYPWAHPPAFQMANGGMRVTSRRSAPSTASGLRPLASVAPLLAAAVFIWAAGNAHGDNCVSEESWCVDGKVAADSVELLAGLTVHFESLREHSIAVVATGEDGAVGDGFSRAFAGREIAAFDALGAPFWFELGDFASAPDGPSIAERLRDFMAPPSGPRAFGGPALAFPDWPEGLERGLSRAEPNPLQFGFLATSARAGSGHLSLAEQASALSLVGNDGLLLTAFSTLGMDRVEPALGGAVRWRPSGAALGLRAGWLAERETMLGTSAEGAFGRLTSHAAFAGVESETDIAGWRVAGATEVGVVTPSLDGGLLTDVSPLTTSTFAVSATRPVGDDSSFRLSVSQPLRVEDGRASLSVPVGRRKRGDVLRDSLTVDLTPSGRQIDVEARWHREGVAGGELRLGAVWTRDPGHRTDAKPGLTLLAGWDRTF